MQHRLLSMGLNVGAEIEVLRTPGGSTGPTLVSVGGTRLAVGRGMADRIAVEPLPAGPGPTPD